MDNFIIHARAVTDDGVFNVLFEAEPWFVDASDDDIVKLFDDGLSDSYQSDIIGRFCCENGNNKYLECLFTYLEYIAEYKNHPVAIGYSIRINTKDALKWVKENRPAIYERCYEAYRSLTE
jgi:hypothetical protein